MEMKGVTEYAEEMPVELVQTTGAFVSLSVANKGAGRWVVKAKNEAGHNCTEVDVLELVDWLCKHRPDLMSNYGMAKAVAAAEREACAALVEAGKIIPTRDEGTVVVDWDCSEEAAAAIRARSNIGVQGRPR